MQSCPAAQAVAGSGLAADRYHRQTGHWQAIEACQVTLITAHDLHRAGRRATPAMREVLLGGGHRRNLVIAGLRTAQLRDRRLRIGSAVFRYQKPRPPCGHLDQVAGRGMARALAQHSGICLVVEASGTLTVGDPLELL